VDRLLRVIKCHSGQKCCIEELAGIFFVDGATASLAYRWEKCVTLDGDCAEKPLK